MSNQTLSTMPAPISTETWKVSLCCRGCLFGEFCACVRACITVSESVWVSIPLFCFFRSSLQSLCIPRPPESRCAVFMLILKLCKWSQRHKDNNCFLKTSNMLQRTLRKLSIRSKSSYFPDRLFIIGGLGNSASLISNIWLCHNGPLVTAGY